ncbi:MAG: nitrilase-related carbon-nitrogen hydrolase [candidate division WOR-3 bacterium]
MKIKVGYLQFYPHKGNPDANIDKVKKLVEGANFDILVLPELAFSGYFFEDKDEILPYVDEGFSSQPAVFLRELAHSKEALIISGFPEKVGSVIYNSQYAFFPDGKVVVYRKSHLFYKEKHIFSPGNTGPVVVSFKGAKIGLMVCFDWIFPEFARVLALRGAHILALSANLVLPGLGQKGMQVRSIENRVFSILANRIGEELSSAGEKIIFTGMSQIFDPAGNSLASSDPGTEELVVVEIEPQKAEDKWITPLNNIFEDRRKEFYEDLL